MHLRAWLILLAILVGNCGFWLFCFNRINATGIPRRLTKAIEKVCILACFAIPLAILLWEREPIGFWLSHSQAGWWPVDAPVFFYYSCGCLVSLLVLGSLWLESRAWLVPPKHQVAVRSEVFHVDGNVEGGSAADRLTRFLCDLPGSDIGYLDVNRKQLEIARPIKGIDQVSIGHLSDLHFTGQYRPEHYHFVIDRLLELSPDLIVISGDIIDYDQCLSWIEPLLGRLAAPGGCYFVLGNHDLRISNVRRLVDSLEGLGHVDLGKRPAKVELASGVRVELIGNEAPWFRRHEQPAQFPSELEAAGHLLRIAVSHAPDQIAWARRCGADLMLAGHTHGGQVRFPLIGPIVAPSVYGSRFASGVFYLDPTLMHVSRGIAGTHPLRWRCKPEVSLLTFAPAS